MLTGITLENFKAFKEPQFIPIKPITLVFGPNSAGKSSIMHALAFLKHVDATKGHCDPDSVEFGWEKIKLGSWQNLVHGHDASAVMKITLHWKNEELKWEKALRWEFRKGPDGPYVKSFEISENGKPVARGENKRTKGILWAVELHPGHFFWDSLKEAIWGNMTKITSLDDQDLYEQIGDDFGDLGQTDIQGEELQVKNFSADRLSNGNVRQNMKPFFEHHFGEWLGQSWRELPSNAFSESGSMMELFPGASTDMESILSFPEELEIPF